MKEQQEEKLFVCRKECLLKCKLSEPHPHRLGDEADQYIHSHANCDFPACVPAPEPKKEPYNHKTQFANCKTCKWEAEVCCCYESECDGTSHYEPKHEGEQEKWIKDNKCLKCNDTYNCKIMIDKDFVCKYGVGTGLKSKVKGVDEIRKIKWELEDIYCGDCDRDVCPSSKCFHRLQNIRGLLSKLRQAIERETKNKIELEMLKDWIKYDDKLMDMILDFEYNVRKDNEIASANNLHLDVQTHYKNKILDKLKG